MLAIATVHDEGAGAVFGEAAKAADCATIIILAGTTKVGTVPKRVGHGVVVEGHAAHDHGARDADDVLGTGVVEHHPVVAIELRGVVVPIRDVIIRDAGIPDIPYSVRAATPNQRGGC